MRGKDLIGRPVIGQNGRSWGEVSDLLVDPSEQKLVALALRSSGFFGGAKFVDFGSVASFGPDVVLVDDEPVPVARFGSARTWAEAADLIGKRYISPSGSSAGILEDLIFDEISGRVTAFRLSGGFIQDLIDGRQTVTAAPVMITEDAVVSGGVSGLNLGPGIED